MKLKINKALLSLSTAFLMITSFLSCFASAADVNYITVSVDKATVKPGETVNVYVELTPDSTGVAGFTADLCYDPQKLSVYVPNEAQMATSFKPNSKFMLSADYSSRTGAVRVSGMELNGTNVTEKSQICIAQFVVNSGVTSGANFWVQVDTMVASQGDSFVNAKYEGNLNSSPVGIVIDNPNSDVQTSETEKVTSKPAETTKPEVTAAPESTEKPKTTTSATTESAQAKETTQTEASAKKDEVKATSKPIKKPVKTAPTVTENTKTTDESQKTSQTSDKKEPESTKSSESLFNYTQGDTDFNSEEKLQYQINLNDYIDDYSANYDIKVKLSSTGNVSGGIGMMQNDEWVYEPNKSLAGNEIEWEMKNVDPNTSNGTAFVQLYYLKANSDLKINSVTVTPVEQVNAQTDISSNDSEPTEQIPSVAGAEQSGTDEPESDDNDIKADDQDGYEDDPENDDGDIYYGTADDSNDDTDVDYEGEDENSENSIQNAPDSIENNIDSKINPTPNNVEKAVTDAASKAAAQPDNTNPNTGSEAGKSVTDILTLLAGAYVLFSVFVFVYGKAAKKKKD